MAESPEGPAAGYGAAPEPGSAYPDSAQGGFPLSPPPGPPPGGQYGPPGPGYAPGEPAAYGAQPPRATASFRHAWRAFVADPWPFVLAQLIWLVIVAAPAAALLAVLGVFGAPQIQPDGSTTGGPRALLGLGGLAVVALAVLLLVLQMGAFATATLATIDGARVVLRDFFRPRNPGQLLLLALVLAAASGLLAITLIGPLIVMFVGIWAVFFVVDRGEPGIAAVRSGARFGRRRPGQTIEVVVLGCLVGLAGDAAFGVGTLITGPLVLLAFADFYRRSISRP